MPDDFTDVKLADGTTLKLRGANLAPDVVKQKVAAYRAKLGAPKTNAPTAPTAPANAPSFGPSATAGLQQQAVSGAPGLASKVGGFLTKQRLTEPQAEKILYPEPGSGAERQRTLRDKAIAEGRPAAAAFRGFQTGLYEQPAKLLAGSSSIANASLLAANLVFKGAMGRLAMQGVNAAFGIQTMRGSGIKKASDLLDPDKLEQALFGASMAVGSAGHAASEPFRKGVAEDLRISAETRMGKQLGAKLNVVQEKSGQNRPGLEAARLGDKVTRDKVQGFQQAADTYRQAINEATRAKMSAVEQASKQGVKLNVEKPLQEVFVQHGQKAHAINNASVTRSMLDWYAKITTDNYGTPQARPRNMQALDPVEAQRITEGLRQKLGTLSKTDAPLEKALRQAEHVIDGEMGRQIPGVSKHDQVITSLITAEEAAYERKAAAKATTGKSLGRLIGTTVGSAAVAGATMVALKYAGIPSAYWLGLPVIFGLRNLYQRLPVQSHLAFYQARLADLLHDDTPKATPTQGPGQPQAPMPMAGPGRQVGPGGPGGQPPIQLGPVPGAGGGAPPQAAPGGGGGGAAAAQPQAAAATQGAAAGAGAATTGAPPPMTPAAQAFQASLDRLTKALPAPPPPRFVKGQSVRMKAAEAGEVGKVTAVHGGTLTVEFKDGYRALSRDEVVRHIPEPKAKGPGANRAELRDYAKQVVAGGVVKGVSLIGSSVKGAGKDIDLLYDLGDVKLPKEPGAAADELERLLESNQAMDFDKHDTFVKAGDRYFHLSSGAGRSWVENTDYAKQQGSKPSAVLARSAAKTRSAPAAATKPQSPQGAAELQPSGSAAPVATQQATDVPEVKQLAEGESGDRRTKWRLRKAAEREKGRAEKASELANQARAAGVTAKEGPSEAIAQGAKPGEHRQAIETGLGALETLGPQGKLLADAYKKSMLSNRQMDDAEKFDTLMEMIKSARDAGRLK